MKKMQSGFTLIELVMVIVILGILAASALPKFVDLSDDANQAAVDGVAGAVSSAGSINYAQNKVNAGGVAITDAADACAAATNSVYAGRDTLLMGSISLVNIAPTASDEYQISESGILGACAAGTTIECTITNLNTDTSTAYIPCTN